VISWKGVAPVRAACEASLRISHSVHCVEAIHLFQTRFSTRLLKEQRSRATNREAEFSSSAVPTRTYSTQLPTSIRHDGTNSGNRSEWTWSCIELSFYRGCFIKLLPKWVDTVIDSQIVTAQTVTVYRDGCVTKKCALKFRIKKSCRSSELLAYYTRLRGEHSLVEGVLVKYPEYKSTPFRLSAQACYVM
jgi:hypothetical protein